LNGSIACATCIGGADTGRLPASEFVLLLRLSLGRARPFVRGGPAADRPGPARDQHPCPAF
jgi:hypothetical protein